MTMYSCCECPVVTVFVVDRSIQTIRSFIKQIGKKYRNNRTGETTAMSSDSEYSLNIL